MKFTIDTHTHTLVSGHAYNTIDEMAAFAAEKGVTHLACTKDARKYRCFLFFKYGNNPKDEKRRENIYGV